MGRAPAPRHDAPPLHRAQRGRRLTALAARLRAGLWHLRVLLATNREAGAGVFYRLCAALPKKSTGGDMVE